MGCSAAGLVLASRQLNAGVRPRAPVRVGLALSAVLLLASWPVARFVGEKARAVLQLGERLPWNQPLDEI